MINIERSSEQLGITIEEGSGVKKGVFVSSVSEHSLAAQVGLQVGDQLLDVCGINLRNAGKEQAALVLHHSSSTVTIKVQFNPVDYHQSVVAPGSVPPQGPQHLSSHQQLQLHQHHQLMQAAAVAAAVSARPTDSQEMNEGSGHLDQPSPGPSPGPDHDVSGGGGEVSSSEEEEEENLEDEQDFHYHRHHFSELRSSVKVRPSGGGGVMGGPEAGRKSGSPTPRNSPKSGQRGGGQGGHSGGGHSANSGGGQTFTLDEVVQAVHQRQNSSLASSGHSTLTRQQINQVKLRSSLDKYVHC